MTDSPAARHGDCENAFPSSEVGGGATHTASSKYHDEIIAFVFMHTKYGEPIVIMVFRCTIQTVLCLSPPSEVGLWHGAGGLSFKIPIEEPPAPCHHPLARQGVLSLRTSPFSLGIRYMKQSDLPGNDPRRARLRSGSF
jgi:hypothetical protein